MKKFLPLLATIVLIVCAQAQNKSVDNNKITIFKRLPNDTINRWSLDFSVGQSKGVNPYTAGYFSSNPKQYFGSGAFGHFGLAGRYMFSPKMGIKLGADYDILRNNLASGSKEFRMDIWSFKIEGVINVARLLDVQDSFGRLGLLFHGGLQSSAQTPKFNSGIPAQNFNVTEYNGGITVGVTPQYRITDRIALFGDVSILNNYRQHLAWDGFYSTDYNNLAGKMITYSGGLSIALGKGEMHADWAKIPNVKTEREEALQKRVIEVEALMNDTDRDGVPDYLDQENNSTAGVAVDTRGKMVDLNRNGVSDEMEKYLNNNFARVNASNDMMTKYINDGYAAAYFDFNDVLPTNVSTNGINFIWTYLKNNPSKTINIIGYADEIGKSDSNDSLSMKRAENVKAILVKAGVNPERLFIKPKGEDASVDQESEGARKLVRKVIFSVNR